MNEDRILYFVILIILIYFYKRRTSIGFLKFLSEIGKEKKINPINNDLSTNERLDEEVKGYKLDSKALGWIIVIYLIYGLIELLIV